MVKKTISLVASLVLRLALKLRYKVTLVGDSALLGKKGMLVLANHPALIDPCVLTAYFWPQLRFHPIAIDFLEQNSLIRTALGLYETIYVPGFDHSSNSYKRYRIAHAYETIATLLKRGENVLIYPSGGLQAEGVELIGGASGLHHVLQSVPNAPILLIKTTGLFGSQFSQALTGKTPDILGTFLRGVKIVLKNGIFFCPKRRLTIEYAAAPADFPRVGKRRELNAYLERWFNPEGAAPITLVSYSCFRTVLPTVYQKPPAPEIIIDDIPVHIKELVKAELSQLASTPRDDILETHDLAFDLGLDSLDRAQLVLFLREHFGILNVSGSQLTTVAHVMAIAAKQLQPEGEENDEFELKTPEWEDVIARPVVSYPDAPTLLEGFLQTCDRMDDWIAAVDQSLGEVSYRRMKLGVILFAKWIRTLEGEQVGILLPASIAANVLILATQLAGKVPVMINWTLGQRNLHAILSQTKMHATLSSWKFLDRLEHVDLNGLNEQIVTVESIKQQMSLKDKLHAWWLSRKSPQALLKAFGQAHLGGESRAVILFTSGTESLPKGVPLTHRNLMSNQRAALSLFALSSTDALLSFLPPFHSFGFSVTGLLPFLIGWRVAFMPNPTQGRRLAAAIQRWKITTLCSAPTFLRSLLRGSEPEQLQSVQFIVTGAESCPKELQTAFKESIPHVEMLEGYGITECAPILTLNPLHAHHHGVGIPIEGVDIKIVDPQTLTPLPTGTPGLILAAGPNVFAGYLNRALSSPFITLEGRQWYDTGDLGQLNEQGYLSLAGRLKRFVKIGGEMVSLGAIEHVLLSHHTEGQAEGDSPILAVCALEDVQAKTQLHVFTTFPVEKQTLNDLLRESGMSNLIRVSAVHQIPLMPLLGTGKIDYQTLAKRIVKS